MDCNISSNKMKIFTSNSKFACKDFCIQDAGTTCNYCSRFSNTEYVKKEINKMKKEEKIKVLCKDLDDLFSPFTKVNCATCTNCCCNHCNLQWGYLQKEQFLELKKEYKYTEKKGFLTSHGCSLPREKRSRVCLRHTCHKMLKDMIHQEINISFELNNKTYNLKEHKEYIFDFTVRKIVEQVVKLRGY